MLKWLDKFGPKRAQREAGFIYVMLPLSIMPVERGEIFEDPIDAELQKFGLGCVSGGGSSLGELDENGHRTVVYCGVDVEAEDLNKVRALLRQMLPGLGAPDQTALEYDIGDDRLEDRYSDGEWVISIPRVQTGHGLMK